MLTLLLLSSVVSGYNWGQPSSRSELVSNYLVNSTDSSDWTLVEVFQGNRSHTDHFKLLKEDGMSVLVGARNVIYNISLVDLSEHVHEVGRFSNANSFCSVITPGENFGKKS